MPTITVGMIVFNGDYVLEECLSSIYPFVQQIIVAEGPVQFWQEQGHTTSTDKTNDILHNFYDPDKKLKVLHGQYIEKTDQSNLYMKFVNPNTDYIWHIDCDEVYKENDIKTILSLLEQNQYTSIGLQFCTFYGGFDHVLGGFEENTETHRIKRIYPGSYWSTHRPPTIAHRQPNILQNKHLDYKNLFNNYGVQIYHYSYVFPKQVKEKLLYYKQKISKDNCINNYYQEIYEPWTKANLNNDELTKSTIEDKYNGVHEFLPSYRGECRTKKFEETHPYWIDKNMEKLKNKLIGQL